MKKAFKKIMTMALVLCLVFSFTVKPKKADASVAGLTAAGIAAAAGIPLSTALLGIGGLAAVGAALYYQDDIVSVGTKMAGQLALKGLLTSDYVNEETGAVTLNGDLVDAAASGVHSLPKVRTISNETTFATGLVLNGTFAILANVDMPIIDTLNNQDTFRFTYTITNPSGDYRGQYLRVYNAAGAMLIEDYTVAGANSSITETFDLTVKKSDMPLTLKAKGYVWYGQTITSLNVKDLTFPTREETNKTVENAPTTINDMQTYAYTNNVTNNTMTINPTQDVTGITVNDLYQTSYDNLNESILQTGILTKVMNGINGLGGSIAAAATAAATAINTKSQDLWEDAGAIWTGMNNTLTGVRTDINAKIGALSDATVNGIDNVRTDIGAMMDRLSAGIDSVATSAAANMAAWGQLTLDGIDAGVGTITNGLTSIWERVGAIPAAIDTAATTTAETITGTFVLSEPQKLENEQNMTATRALLLQKFEWIITPIEDIKGLYGQRKSLYDVTFNVLGQEVHVLPIEYQGVISGFRPVVSGAAIMSTIIFIYRRIQPKEVV